MLIIEVRTGYVVIDTESIDCLSAFYKFSEDATELLPRHMLIFPRYKK